MPVALPILLLLGGVSAVIAAVSFLSDAHDKPPDLPSAPPGQTRWRYVNAMLPELRKASESSKIPLGLLAGWVAKESGGKIATHPQPGPGDTKYDERGYFQLMPEESASLGLDHQRLSVDPVYSINAGLLLIGKYARRVDGFGIARGSPMYWRFVKFLHSIGSGDAKTLIEAASARGKLGSWEAFRDYAMSPDAPRTKHSPKKWIGLVDKVYEVGKPFGFGEAHALVVGADLRSIFTDIPDPLDAI